MISSVRRQLAGRPQRKEWTGSPSGAEAVIGPAIDRGRVLLVEDDFMLRTTLADILSVEGYNVESAADGAEALRRLGQSPRPSVILLDLMMPRMDGIEFRTLQRMDPAISDIPVIVITAVGIRPDVARELDFQVVFAKPLDRRRLLDAITRACGGGEADV